MATPPASTSASPRAKNSDPLTHGDNGASQMSVDEKQDQSNSQQQQQNQQQSPEKLGQQMTKQAPQASSEQKRPMNAFLLFCKQQRSSVREKHPNLENREITRILGDWWSKLDKEQKSKYTDMARQHKQAFMETNPDFKWCKTTMTPYNNNNNCHHSNSITNNDDSSNRQPTTKAPAADMLHLDSRDTSVNSKQPHGAPKPPKKRYLERSEAAYSKVNPNITNSNSRDNIVPYLSLDQAMLDRVIEKALSEKSADSPSGSNMCKETNGDSTSNNCRQFMGIEQNPVSTLASAIPISTQTATTTSSISPSYSNGEDEPVDFSMKVTFRTTNQLIIDNVIEKAYSGPVAAIETSRSGDVGNVHSQLGPAIKRVNTEVT